MNHLIADPIMFTALVCAEVTFGGHFLLWATLSFPQLPGNRRFPLRQLPFPIVFLTETAVAFALWVKHRRLSRLFGVLRSQKYMPQPDLTQFSVDFNQDNEYSNEN